MKSQYIWDKFIIIYNLSMNNARTLTQTDTLWCVSIDVSGLSTVAKHNLINILNQDVRRLIDQKKLDDMLKELSSEEKILFLRDVINFSVFKRNAMLISAILLEAIKWSDISPKGLSQEPLEILSKLEEALRQRLKWKQVNYSDAEWLVSLLVREKIINNIHQWNNRIVLKALCIRIFGDFNQYLEFCKQHLS